MRGFTLIELLIVISIMIAMLAVATPTVSASMQRATLRNAVGDVGNAWSIARSLALKRRPPVNGSGAPRHFGIRIVQKATGMTEVSVIYSNGTAVALADPTTDLALGTDIGGQSSKPVGRFPVRAARLATAATVGATPTVQDETLVIYAQYGTGFPIADSAVSSGAAGDATAIGLGVKGAGSGMPEVTRFQFSSAKPDPLDTAPFALLHVGVATALAP
jgi:prepilin-type N-terminal cleavage/methylation domain-containing protein